MKTNQLSRRAVLTGSTAALVGFAATDAARADLGAGEEFVYEIQRTEAEWRDRLTRTEYRILRDGGTEWRNSSPLRNEQREGTYHCKGCGLPVYTSDWKVRLDIGWVFFTQSRPNTVLMSIDSAPAYGGENSMPEPSDALIETHCRRCGSHFGHLVAGNGTVLHCINGASLVFEPGAV